MRANMEDGALVSDSVSVEIQAVFGGPRIYAFKIDISNSKNNVVRVKVIG